MSEVKDMPEDKAKAVRSFLRRTTEIAPHGNTLDPVVSNLLDCSQCNKWTPEEGFTRKTALAGFCSRFQGGVRSDEPCDQWEKIANH